MSEWKQDAGHGGSDPGAVKNGQQEKVWTLEAAIYVDKRLNELGITSSSTRTKDVTLAQSKRTGDVAKCDKAISHHYNAGGGAGAEFIYSIYANGEFEDILIDEFKKAGYPVRRKFQRKYGNNDYYYMHRETGRARTTIVEYDFLDGDNFSKLKSKSYREGMYECVVKAICRDEGVKYVSHSKKDQPKKEASKSSNSIHVVKSGDTLWGIANGHNTTVSKLKQLNGLKDDLIKPGQKLKLIQSKPKQKYIRVKTSQLWVYDKPDWNAKHKIVKENEVFTIKRTIKVDGHTMHQLKSGLYITNNSKYVEVYQK